MTRHKLDHDAKAAVRFKDLLVAGSVITGFANIAVEELMRRRHCEGFAVDKNDRRSSNGAGEPEGYRRYFDVMGPVNRTLVAGAVAATPFINFSLFNAYKPHPIRSLLKL